MDLDISQLIGLLLLLGFGAVIVLMARSGRLGKALFSNCKELLTGKKAPASSSDKTQEPKP